MLPPKRTTRSSDSKGVAKAMARIESIDNEGLEEGKTRRKLTAAQKQLLEKHMERERNPSLETRRALADQLGL